MFFRHGFSTFCTLVCIGILCLLPGSGMPDSPFVGMDKFVHAFLFLVLAFQMLTFCQKQYSVTVLRLKPLQSTIVICVFYGALIELIQGSFVYNREADLIDLLFDMFGVALGFLLFYFIHKKLNYKLHEKIPSKNSQEL